MKDNKLNNIPEGGNIIDETAFCEKVQESIEEEGRYYRELNEQLKNDPEYMLTPEKLAMMEQRLKHPYRLGRSRVRTYRRLNKAAISISIILVLLIAGVMSVSSLRDYTINFLLSFDNTYAKSDSFNDIVSPNAPSLLPKGYSFSSYKVADDMIILEYVDSDYNILTFTQFPIDNPTIVDTENAQVDDVTIGEYKGTLSKKEDGQVSLIWQTEKYQFLLSSNVPIDLVPVAESVSIN